MEFALAAASEAKKSTQDLSHMLLKEDQLRVRLAKAAHERRLWQEAHGHLDKEAKALRGYFEAERKTGADLRSSHERRVAELERHASESSLMRATREEALASAARAGEEAARGAATAEALRGRLAESRSRCSDRAEAVLAEKREVQLGRAKLAVLRQEFAELCSKCASGPAWAAGYRKAVLGNTS